VYLAWIRLSAVITLVLLLTACQPVALLNSVIPKSDFLHVKDLCYGAHPRQCMDIYSPTAGDRDAVVIFVYGGAWDRGSKDDFLFVGEAFASLGYTTVIPDYRLYPEVVFPAFVEDVAAAIAALDDYLEDAGRPIVLAGHSAGAHSAALLASDPQYLQKHGMDLSRIHALIALSGPYDLPLDHERVVDKFPGVDDRQANPVALASSEHPPTLLIHGGRDTVAEPQHSERYAAALEALGVPVVKHLYSRRRHVDVVASLARPLRFLSPAYQDIAQYLQALNSAR